MHLVLRTAGAWLLLVSLAAGRDVFVDNRFGNDRSDGSHPTLVTPRAAPVATIAKALVSRTPAIASCWPTPVSHTAKQLC